MLILLAIVMMAFGMCAMTGQNVAGSIFSNVASAQTTKPLNAKRWGDNMRGGRPVRLYTNRFGTTGTVAVWGANVQDPYRANSAPGGMASLADPNAQQANTQIFKGDGVTQAFASTLTYAAFSNYNWMLELSKWDRYPMAAQGFTISNVSGLATVTFVTETFSGDGATTAFTMASLYDLLSPPISEPSNQPGPYCTLIVKVGGVTQVLGTDYTISNVNGAIVITFTVAPANVANNVTAAIAPAPGVDFALLLVTPVALVAASSTPAPMTEIVGKDRYWGVLASSPSASSAWVEGLR